MAILQTFKKPFEIKKAFLFSYRLFIWYVKLLTLFIIEKKPYYFCMIIIMTLITINKFS